MSKLLSDNDYVKKGRIVILPEHMNKKDLDVKEMIYLSMYDIWGNEANKLLEPIMSRESLIRYKKKLINLGYLKPITLTPEEAKEQTIKMSHKGMVCEWCGKECYTLHEHHYPISAQKGGTETVKICPNCHYTFHSLVGRDY